MENESTTRHTQNTTEPVPALDDIRDVLLAEYGAITKSIDTHRTREGQIFVGLLTATGVAGTFILKDPGHYESKISLLLVVSLFASAAAWAISLQYWDVLWHQYYLISVANPLMRLSKSANDIPPKMRTGLLGFDRFVEQNGLHPRVLKLLGFVGGILWQVCVIGPSVGFMIGAWYFHNKPDVKTETPDAVLLGVTVISDCVLVVCAAAAYYAANIGIRDHGKQLLQAMASNRSDINPHSNCSARRVEHRGWASR